jgi:hypothetical protein
LEPIFNENPGQKKHFVSIDPVKCARRRVCSIFHRILKKGSMGSMGSTLEGDFNGTPYGRVRVFADMGSIWNKLKLQAGGNDHHAPLP